MKDIGKILAILSIGVGGAVSIGVSELCPEYVLHVPVVVDGATTTEDVCISQEVKDFILDSKAPNAGFGGLQFE